MGTTGVVMAPDTPPAARRRMPPRLGLQICIGAGLLVVLVLLGMNMQANIGLLGGRFGFEFLWRPAGFNIGESSIPYSASSPYVQAIAVGFVNTLELALVGAVGSLVLGFAVALLRASGIGPVVAVMNAYVEIVRNTPLLLQLFVWSTLLKTLPAVRQAFEPLPGVLFSNRGFFFPLPSGSLGTALSLFVPLALGAALFTRFRASTPLWRGVRLHHLCSALALGAIVFLMLRPLDMPKPAGFNIRGGGSFSPEFLCMAVGIIFYHATLVAEIVRAGFNSVPMGQHEAGHALGLPTPLIYIKLIIPQALRLIVLPTTALFQGMAKSTSLAVAIGFPELLTVVNTVTGQTGQPIEAALILILCYFVLSLAIAKIGNGLNALVRIKER